MTEKDTGAFDSVRAVKNNIASQQTNDKFFDNVEIEFETQSRLEQGRIDNTPPKPTKHSRQSKSRDRNKSRSRDRSRDRSRVRTAGTNCSKYTEEDLYVKKLLARRSFHLPEHNWFQDWIQFIKNNHPLFGLCLYHPLHPLRLGHRIFIFIGSVAFGLTATNFVYLWYAYSNEDMNKILVEVSLGNTPVISREDLQITYGMVALWTFGGILHSLFDVTLWFMTACICFLEGNVCGRFKRLRGIGSYATIAIVAVFVAIASFAVAGRAIYESRLQAAAEGVILNEEEWLGVVKFESFSFLLGYGVESLLVYFAYYPLMVTIGFSGLLRPFFRCFPCIRFLGGRQNELKKQYEERKMMRLPRDTHSRVNHDLQHDDSMDMA